MPTQDPKDLYKALKDGQISLRAAVRKQAENCNWDVEPDVDTSFVPFPDSAKPRETLGGANANSCDISLDSLVHSQKGEKTKASVGMFLTSGSKRAFCVGMPQLDPKRVGWVFSDSVAINDGFSAVSTIESEYKPGDLLHVSAPGNAPSWSIRREPRSLDGIGTYDEGMSFNKCNPESDNVLSDAHRKILEGTFGLILCFLLRRFTLNESADPHLFVPVIATTANIISCGFDQDGQSIRTSSDAVIYEHPAPMTARFPAQVAGADKRPPRIDRWPVLITNLKGLGHILDRSYVTRRSPTPKDRRSCDRPVP